MTSPASSSPAPSSASSPSLIRYERARRALAEAVAVDEVLAVRDDAERMKLYARQAKDREMMANATELQARATRKLGELMQAAADAGQIARGRPAENGVSETPFPRVTLAEAGIDKHLAKSARRMASISERAFEMMVSQARDKIVSRGAQLVNPVTTAEKQERRAERERSLAATQWPTGKFGVIYADPEWRFEPFSRDTGMDRAPENHFPTSAVDEIARRPVDTLAAKDAVLFLWATVPMLPQAIEVMAAWGFTYRSHFVWIKDRIGLGYWNRNQHELLLVGSRGSIPAPAPGDQWSSVLRAPAGRHSEKPDLAYDMIEAYYPTLPKVELNARARREGWAIWGNAADLPAQEEAHDVTAGERPAEALSAEQSAASPHVPP